MEKITKDFYRELNARLIEEEGSNSAIAIKEVDYDGNLSTFSYIHGGLDFSDRRIRLARGLTLDENDNIVLVGFEKFFCNNQLGAERDWVTDGFANEFSKIQDHGNKLECVEKKDGSMIILGVYKDELITSTTSSINNVISNYALSYFNSLDNKDAIKDYLVEQNSCFVFEYVSPVNRVVVDYDSEDFVLLAQISKETCTEVEIENDFGFARPEVFQYTYEELQNIQKNAINFEGFVVRNDYGRLIKFKTNWWYELHGLTTMFFSDFLSKNNVLEILKAYLNDELDELYSIQNSNEMYKKVGKVDVVVGWIDEIEKVSNKIAKKYKTVREYVESEDYKSRKRYNKIITDKILGRDSEVLSYKVILWEKLKEYKSEQV